MEYAATLAPSSFLQRVFAWMFAGLLVTAAAAAAIGTSDALLTDITANPILLIVLFVAQLGLVIAISARADRMSPALATGLFLLYSATNGVIFALIFGSTRPSRSSQRSWSRPACSARWPCTAT